MIVRAADDDFPGSPIGTNRSSSSTQRTSTPKIGLTDRAPAWSDGAAG
jgi:hypothetical protein